MPTRRTRVKRAGNKLLPRGNDAVPPRDNGKHPGGRPTLFTAERCERLVTAARAGAVLESCADYALITKTTLDNWLQRGEQAADKLALGKADEVAPEDLPFAQFFGVFKNARSDRELEALLTVRTGKAGWQSEAWWLERTMPQKYGRRFVRLEHTGKDGQPIASEVTVKDELLTDDERLRRIRAAIALGEDDETGAAVH